MTRATTTGIAYDREGPTDAQAVLLLHAGVADRRMWDDHFATLTAEFDVVRLDLRGFGASDRQPAEALSAVGDVVDTLTELDITGCHVVGASLGAGVAVEVALTRPDLVTSLLLAAPGGSLLTEATPDLMAFFAAERAALGDHDLDRAVEANLATWVDGPRRGPGDVDAGLRAAVGQMQRRAFEISAGWGDVEEVELDPPTASRLAEVSAPTLVLSGALDLDTCLLAADAVADTIPGARRVDWGDAGHLPSLERPADFAALLRGWLVEHDRHPT
ncbi:alpha/beta fold hydrolase [uncultured Jatrophihabitans sp.]|uniref:alpha/beta fold hydrolase n=1 Tax=uncultured Jatrophihabitans sp. TaxID=1610747 RepID=UPI0035CBB974